MKKIKLIISSAHLDYGGIEKSLLNLLNSLDINKFDITLVLEEKRGVFLSKLNKKINVIEYTPSENKNIFIRKLTNFKNRIIWYLKNHNKFDVSICYATYSMSSNFIARCSSKNRIMWIHSNYCQSYEYDEQKVKGFYNIRSLNKYKRFVFVSNESRNDLIKYYPFIKESSIVINNIVDYEEILSDSKLNINLNLKYKKNGVFIGRIEEPVKKVSRVIELAKYCQDNKKDIGFIIVGDGPDLLYIKSKSEEYKLQNIIFTGAKTNPYPYLEKADFLILTSKYEGFPVVYNEAIILNKPVLTTIDVSDDEISINNNFGIISKPEELKENVDKILKFKNKNIDFEKINKKRIAKIEKLISDTYGKN
ncbi:MAG: glycosyltransferase [Bacilli bacterium]|nr:glycosyltransferase [Bacilli bacterium]